MRKRLAIMLLALACGQPASAQLLPRLGVDPGRLLGGVVPVVGGLAAPLAGVTNLAPRPALRALRDLLRTYPRELEADAAGLPVVRGRVLAIDPSTAGLSAAGGAGFREVGRETLAGVDLLVVALQPPKGMSAQAGRDRLRELDPDGAYDLDSLYAPARSSSAPAAAETAASPPAPAAVAMIDAGVAEVAALRQARVVRRGFAPGAPLPAAHGTAVASLLAGDEAGRSGSRTRPTLYAADVFGGGPTGGAADAVARGLAWAATQPVGVINVSLAGPPNLLLERMVARLNAKGFLIVAAVGNDGPAAPPLYPASYPGVVAVTAVDARGRLLPEAGRAAHVDFAARGVVRAADVQGGWTSVRGTSFASPLVARRLAAFLPRPDPQGRGAALDRLAASARPEPQLGPQLGRGLVE